VDLYSALDDKYLVLKRLRHGSHSLTCKQHHACLWPSFAFTRWRRHGLWWHLAAAYYSFIDPERMKSWVGLVGWPIADGLPTYKVVTSQLQVECRRAKGRRSKTNVLFYRCTM